MMMMRVKVERRLGVLMKKMMIIMVKARGGGGNKKEEKIMENTTRKARADRIEEMNLETMITPTN